VADAAIILPTTWQGLQASFARAVDRPECPVYVDSGRSASERIYKPRRGLNDISVLSSSRDGRSLSASRAVNLANAGLIDGLWLRIGREPLSYGTPD
jgi:hypothetical protein